MDIQSESRRFRRSLIIAGGFVGLLWLIKIAEWMLFADFGRFGILPRSADHLTGIITGPLVHGSFEHLFSNTLPLLVLGTLALHGYPRASRFVIPAIYVGSGIGVWLLARGTYHIGASGLSFGLMFFIFTVGVLRWDKRASALSMLVFFMYGSMIWGIFPGRPGVSFEYHFFGVVFGVLGAVAFRRVDPKPPEKKYSWELEEEEPP